jgi:hypothetical protein
MISTPYDPLHNSRQYTVNSRVKRENVTYLSVPLRDFLFVHFASMVVTVKHTFFAEIQETAYLTESNRVSFKTYDSTQVRI